MTPRPPAPRAPPAPRGRASTCARTRSRPSSQLCSTQPGGGAPTLTGVPPPISAVILSYNRRERLARVLDELERLDNLDEVIVADSSSDGSGRAVEAHGGRARLLRVPDLGAAGRNLGAEAARNELVLMIDDDSHPRPGAVERLMAAFEDNPRLAVATGLVRDVDPEPGETLQSTELGSFDWWLRRGRRGEPRAGFDVYFFAEGGCM